MYMYEKYYPGFKLKEGFRLESTESTGYCGDGGRADWRIVNAASGEIVAEGSTCNCGRGCGNCDCVADWWGYRDTDIEAFRE